MSLFVRKALVVGVLVFAVAAVAAPVQAVTIDELMAQIAALQAQLVQLQGASQTTTPATTTAVSGVPAGFTFAKNLAQGATGEDVKNLQKTLNGDSATQVAASGAGSLGNETSYFGPATKAAVVKFQEKYASSVLTPVGLTNGTGFVGASTRAKLNAMLAGSTTTTTTPTTTTPTTTTPTTTTPAPVTTTPVAGQFTVATAADTPATGTIVQGQSVANLAKFTFANGTANAVKVTTVKLTRLGVSADATLTNTYLYNGASRLTDAASVSSGVVNFNNSAGIFSVPANSTTTITVLSDIAGSTSGQTVGAGIASAAAVVTDGATVSGTFPA
ncbi:MAG: peptidoglycan-binding protein, partial [Candidatus Wildermuthbacteria bacterium]|nr:peptidoglycan-binding protein [Candidatus Wildermuthbacteria bacterium]